MSEPTESAPAVPDEAFNLALAIAHRWRRRRGVVAIGLGQRHRAGAFVPEEICVVITLTDKALDPADLQPRQVFPRTIVVCFEGRDWEVPVDIRGARGVQEVRCQGDVGRAVSVEGTLGALGPLVTTADGTLEFVVAGHAAKTVGRSVRLPWGARGVVSGVWLNHLLDHALVRPEVVPVLETATRPDGVPIQAIAAALAYLKDRTARCYLPTEKEWVVTTIRGWFVGAWVEPRGNQANRTFMQGLVATDRCTKAGDSGTPLYLEPDGELIGTLLGSIVGAGRNEASFSYFVPALTAFHTLNLTLA